MASFDYNPITGQLDLVGSGGGTSYINGVVADPTALPVTLGTPALDSVYLAKAGSGVWLINRRPAGLYVRVANNGVAADWTYLGAFPEVNSSANWELYDGTDPTKELKFDLTQIASGNTRTFTAPDRNGRIGLSDYRVVAASGSAVRGDLIAADTTAGAFTLTLPATPANGDTVYILDYAGTFDTNNLTIARNGSNIESLAENMDCNIEDAAFSLVYVGSTVGWKVVPYFGNKTNFASPDPIGSTIPNTGAFTTLTAASLQNTPIGSATPNTGAFTTLNANTSITGPIGATVGSTSAPAIVFGHSNSGIYVNSNQIIFVKQGVDSLFFDNSARVNVNTTGGLQIVQTDAPIILTRAISLLPDATNGALAQRSGTQAQEYRVYATHTSSTNYQRMTVKSARQTLSALSGASATTTGTFIPDGAVVVGITTRVATAITGATGYTIGDGTDADRWGDITGTAIGTTSDNRDWTAGTIECFTAGGNVTLTAKTSNFTAGSVEICVFYLAGEAD